MKKRPFRPPSVCPVCGERVPPKSLACPECGADERSGWKENAADYDGLNLPDQEEEFDYDDFVKQEFGGAKEKAAAKGWWWVAAVLLLLAFVWAMVWGR